MENKKKICVLGLGFIGLPTACLLADAGYQIVGVDTDINKLQQLKNGQLPFDEPGLKELFERSRPNLTFRNTPEEADVFMICVPTPLNGQNRADLSYVKNAVGAISSFVRPGNLIVTESTIPPRTHDQIIQPAFQNTNVYFAYTPERALVGNTLKEMRENDRIIGVDNLKSGEIAEQLYRSFVTGNIHLTDINSAEIVKLVENAYRDTNIAFANELARICDHLGGDVWEVIRLANCHPRVHVHQPGPGVGGHCLPIDPWFLIENKHTGSQMIQLTRQVNDSMPNYVIDEVAKLLTKVDLPIVTVLGVAYKANVDDARETPAAKIIELARQRGWQVRAHDPLVKRFDYPLTSTLTEAIRDADCLILVTDHQYYREQLTPESASTMRSRIIFDTRGAINPEAWQQAGFIVRTLGAAHQSSYHHAIESSRANS